jgi:hypothetical protein
MRRVNGIFSNNQFQNVVVVFSVWFYKLLGRTRRPFAGLDGTPSHVSQPCGRQSDWGLRVEVE